MNGLREPRVVIECYVFMSFTVLFGCGWGKKLA